MTFEKALKEITNFFALKYENVDRIKNLETEIKVRENAEESLLKQKKGIERIVSQRTTELRDVNEKLRGEIQERRSVLRALQESEQRYRLLAENATDIIWTMSLETMRFTFVSPSVQRIRGFTPEEAIALGLDKTLTSESLEKALFS